MKMNTTGDIEMYSNYEQRDVKYEIWGIEICREELEDSQGKIRLFWTLRNPDKHIIHLSKTWEDLIHKMMFDSVEAFYALGKKVN